MAQSGASSSTQPPAVDPAVAFLNAHAASEEAFFQSGAVELSVSLLGQYLFCHDSNIAVRILETEAYPSNDVVLTKKFIVTKDDVKLLAKNEAMIKGGTLIVWSPPPVESGRAGFKDLYISAGPLSKDAFVYIRSCEPILGLEEIVKNRKNPACPKKKKNLLIGPSNVSEGLKAESWPKNHLLYRNGKVQLFYGARNEGEKLKYGKRILGGCGDTSYKNCLGTDSLYRFALATKENYKYSKKCGGLKDWKV